MTHSKKRVPPRLLAVVVLTVVALLLTSCGYDAGYRIGKTAEKIRDKAEHLIEGFKDRSGWWSSTLSGPLLLSGAVANRR